MSRRGWLGVGLGVWLALPVAATEPEEGTPARAAERFGFTLSKDEPMTITAEELDAARTEKGDEHVIFRRSVKVVQGDLHLSCDWLEAVYPKGKGGKPERITARGSVRIRQAGSEARCSEAILNNTACSVKCMGSGPPASLRRGEETIEGDQIFFDLCKGVLKVRGGARVRMEPQKEAP